MKKIKPHSEVASQAILSIAKSYSFNSQKYIPKDGASFSLFKVEILSGLTVALA
jgi:SulP family sulfate permease